MDNRTVQRPHQFMTALGQPCNIGISTAWLDTDCDPGNSELNARECAGEQGIAAADQVGRR